MKITVLLMIICLTLVGLNAQRLMDSSRSTIGYIDNGRVMNSSRSTIGYIDADRMMNSSRSTIGYFDNGKVMNSSRSTIGYLDNGRVMNNARSTIGYWENGRVQNNSRSTIGYYEGVAGEHAALFFFFFFYDSNTPKVPTISTTAISNLGSTTAISGGNISADGGASVTARGVVWSTNPTPVVTLSTKTSNGTGMGTFTSSLTSLSPNSTYYVRSYATNSAGTAYGNEVSFKTIDNNTMTSGNLTSATNISIKKTWSQQPNGYTYPMNIFVPTGAIPQGGFPVCILLHGNGGNGPGMINQFLSTLSCHILVAPSGYQTSWNICAENSDAPDVEMIQDLVINLQGYTNVNPNKIRILGSSNGAGLANRIFIENTNPGIDIICAIVSHLNEPQYHSGNFYKPGNATDPSGSFCGYNVLASPLKTRKYLSISNDNDNLIPYLGGTSVVGVSFLAAETAALTIAKYKGHTNNILATGVTMGDPSISEFSYLSGDVVHLKGNAMHGTNATQRSYIKKYFSDCQASTSVPVISTSTVTDLGTTTATSGGNVSADGGASVTARGVVWSTNPTPVISLSTKTSNGTGTGTFTSSLTSLSPNTTFYVRAYATNSAGTAYGNEVSFKTNNVLASVPTLSTSTVTDLGTTTATSGGNVSADGGASVTARGVVWSTNPSPIISLSTKTSNGTGTGTFTSSLTSLSPNTTYYVRAYATNSAGTAYGNEVSFKTIDNNTMTSGNLTSATNISIKKTWSQQPNGYTYPMNIFVPTGAVPQGGFPVCILLHGNGGNGAGMINQFLATLSCHILVAPSGYQTSWNICAENSDAPDVEMIQDLVNNLQGYTNVNPNKIRILGSSNGAGLANRIFIENTNPGIDIICAIVSHLNEPQYHSGNFYKPGNTTDPSGSFCGYNVLATPLKTRKYLSISNDNDNLIPYLGGTSVVGVSFLAAETAALTIAKYKGYPNNILATGVTMGDPSISEFSYLSGDVVHLKGNAMHGTNATQRSYIKKYFSDCQASTSTASLLPAEVFEISPNPASDNVDILSLSDISGNATLHLIGLNGQQLLTKKFNGLRAGESIRLPLNQVNSGLYFLQIRTEKGVWVRKMEIMR